MRRHLRTPSTWIAFGALIFAMTGSAVGASLITGSQIKDASITSKDIKNQSLQLQDLSGAAQRAMKGGAAAAGDAAGAAAGGAAGGPAGAAAGGAAGAAAGGSAGAAAGGPAGASAGAAAGASAGAAAGATAGADAVKPGAWVPINATGGAAPAFGTGWSAAARTATPADNAVPAMRKEGDVVRLRGAIGLASNPATGSVAFTLAPGFRPARREWLVVSTGALDSGTTFSDDIGELEIRANGDVFFTAFGDDRFVSLSGVTFVAG